MKPDIFISYSRKDESVAKKLANDIISKGGNIWMDVLHIESGERWDQTIEEALEKSSHIMVLLSKSSVTSHNVLDEVSYALEETKTIIPVLIEDCKVPFRLRRLQRVDFTGDYMTGFNQILNVLKLNDKNPTQSPAKSKVIETNKKNEPKIKKTVGKNGVKEKSKDQEIKTKESAKYLEQNLAIETVGGVATVLAEKGSVLPFEYKQTFSTAADNQPKVEIHLLYGNRNLAIDCTSLGNFVFDKIPPAKKGVPQIEIAIEIKDDGRVFILAENLDKGNKKYSKMGSVPIVDEAIKSEDSKPELIIVSCTKCGSKARIKNSIPRKGVKIKCPKCSHQYKVMKSIIGVFTSEL